MAVDGGIIGDGRVPYLADTSHRFVGERVGSGGAKPLKEVGTDGLRVSRPHSSLTGERDHCAKLRKISILLSVTESLYLTIPRIRGARDCA